MCSELTPRAPILDGRMAQFMQPFTLTNRGSNITYDFHMFDKRSYKDKQQVWGRYVLVVVTTQLFLISWRGQETIACFINLAGDWNIEYRLAARIQVTSSNRSELIINACFVPLIKTKQQVYQITNCFHFATSGKWFLCYGLNFLTLKMNFPDSPA